MADTGCGIPPQIADKIFDPFFTTKTPDKGTGLGLSTVVGIVKNHGGFVDFSSRPGKGTKFKVYLPAEPGEPTGERVLAAGETLRGQNEMILVVDDEDAVRSMMRLILESHGFRTILATSGSEALDVYTRNQSEIRLVLTDLSMPGMGGINVINGLRKINPAVRIILISGQASLPDGSSIETLQVDAFMHKPFDPPVLLNTIHHALRSAR